jgi:hypothetical protein
MNQDYRCAVGIGLLSMGCNDRLGFIDDSLHLRSKVIKPPQNSLLPTTLFVQGTDDGPFFIAEERYIVSSWNMGVMEFCGTPYVDKRVFARHFEKTGYIDAYDRHGSV